jgi:hypothetical protein
MATFVFTSINGVLHTNIVSLTTMAQTFIFHLKCICSNAQAREKAKQLYGQNS